MTEVKNSLKEENKFILYFYFYFFMMPWNLTNSQMGILTGILLVSWIVNFKNKIKSIDKNIFLYKPILALLLFIIFAYFSSLWSESIKDGFDNVNKYYKYFLILIPIMLTSLNSKQAYNSILIMAFSFVSYSFFSFLIYVGLFELTNGSNSLDPKGIFGFSTSTQYMSLGFLILFSLSFFVKSKNMKVLFILFSFLCLFAVFINNSRTSMLAVMLTFLLISMVVIYNKFEIKKMIISVGILILLIITSFFILNKLGKLNKFNHAISDIQTLINKKEYDGSLGVRLYMNKVGFETLLENPLIGVGPVDNNDLLVQRMKTDDYYKGPIIKLYHSFHWDTLTKYGLIGYSLIALSIIFLLYSLRNDKKHFLIALSVFTFLFLVSLSNGTLDKKPINYIYLSLFFLLSIISYHNFTDSSRIKNDKN